MGPNAKGAVISIAVVLIFFLLVSILIAWTTGSWDASSGVHAAAATTSGALA